MDTSIPDWLTGLASEKLVELSKDSPYHCFVESDAKHQRVLRLMQSIWRIEMDFDHGLNSRAKKANLGSMISKDIARSKDGVNFLTDEAKIEARESLRLAQAVYRNDKPMIQASRLYENLLSSQPLAFNLFAPFTGSNGFEVLSRVLGEMLSIRGIHVSRLEFEFSPGRGRKRYSDDHSAFDVYIEYFLEDESRHFLGIEVKYHENLRGKPTMKQRYKDISEASGIFRQDAISQLVKDPLNQIWRDHLLALSMISPPANLGFDSGKFVLLYPKINLNCQIAVDEYLGLMQNNETFENWTMESFLTALLRFDSSDWIYRFFERYLKYSRVIDKLNL